LAMTLKKQIRLGSTKWQIADFIDDE